MSIRKKLKIQRCDILLCVCILCLLIFIRKFLEVVSEYFFKESKFCPTYFILPKHPQFGRRNRTNPALHCNSNIHWLLILVLHILWLHNVPILDKEQLKWWVFTKEIKAQITALKLESKAGLTNVKLRMKLSRLIVSLRNIWNSVLDAIPTFTGRSLSTSSLLSRMHNFWQSSKSRWNLCNWLELEFHGDTLLRTRFKTSFTLDAKLNHVLTRHTFNWTLVWNHIHS